MSGHLAPAVTDSPVRVTGTLRLLPAPSLTMLSRVVLSAAATAGEGVDAALGYQSDWKEANLGVTRRGEGRSDTGLSGE